MKIKQYITYLTLLFFISACNSEKDKTQVKQLIEKGNLIIDDDVSDFLSHEDKDLVSVLNVSGNLKLSILTPEIGVYRRVYAPLLLVDTLCYLIDYSDWNKPDSINESNRGIRYEIKIAIKDIDTSSVQTYLTGDLKWLQFSSIDTNQVTWLKEYNYDNQWNQIFKVKSSTIQFPYFKSIEPIKNNFSSYIMWNSSNALFDYCSVNAGVIETDTIINAAINIINKCVRTHSKSTK